MKYNLSVPQYKKQKRFFVAPQYKKQTLTLTGFCCTSCSLFWKVYVTAHYFASSKFMELQFIDASYRTQQKCHYNVI